MFTQDPEMVRGHLKVLRIKSLIERSQQPYFVCRVCKVPAEIKTISGSWNGVVSPGSHADIQGYSCGNCSTIFRTPSLFSIAAKLPPVTVTCPACNDTAYVPYSDIFVVDLPREVPEKINTWCKKCNRLIGLDALVTALPQK